MIVRQNAWLRYRILLVVPVYNEERMLPVLLHKTTQCVPKEHILIVNDGSTDATQSVIDAYHLAAITHSENRGKGFSLRHAMSFAKQHNFHWVICMDGDGQHEPDHLAQFLRAIAHDGADIILGFRQATDRCMPLHRRLSNGISSILISLLIGGRRIHDTQCGYRALRLAVVKDDDFRESGFQFESELLLRLGKSRRFMEVPITTCYGEERSKIRVLHDSGKFIRLLIRYIWWFN